MTLVLDATAWSVAQVLADSGGGDDASGLAFVLLCSGFVFYGIVYLRYRNTDKRHGHESETEASMHDVRVEDRFTRSLKGVSHSRMKGANHRDVRGARRG